MSETRILGTEDLDEWYRYYDRLAATGPYHDPAYVSFLAGNLERETRAECFVAEADGEVVFYPYLVRPLSSVPFADTMDRDPDAYADVVSSWYYGGPLVSDPTAEITSDYPTLFGTHCREAGIVAEFVRFDPNIGNHEWFPGLDPTHNRQTVWVDLSHSPAELLSRCEKRCRNAIHQARETDLAVRATEDAADIAAFHRIYANAMDAKDATQQYRFDREFFEDLLSMEFTSMLVVTHGDEVVGGSVLVHDDHIVHDYLRATNPDYWDMRVNNLLCFEAMLYARETGRERFDFQGGRPGVFRFKKSFSPDRADFYIAKRVHDETAYDALVETATAAGVDTDSGYFPAYRLEQSN